MRVRASKALSAVPLLLFATAAFAQNVHVKLLSEKLISPDGVVRRAAAAELGDLGASAAPAAHLLVDAMTDKDIMVRAEAGSALVKIGDAAIPALTDGLRDPKEGIGAALVLTKMGNAGLRVLVDGLLPSNPTARINAIAGISTLGPAGKRVVPTIVEYFRTADGDGRAAAAQALGKLAESSGPVVAAAVTAAMKDPETNMRLGAIATVAQMGAEGVSAAPALVERLSDPQAAVKQAAQDALVALGVPTIPALRAALANPAITADAALVLAHFGELGAPALVEALSAEPVAQRLAATAALGEMGPAAASSAMVLAKALHDPEPRVRASAARALGRMGGGAGGTVSNLIEALKDRDDSVRANAAQALGGIGAVGVVANPSLVAALSDPSPAVRAAAAAALATTDIEGKLSAIPLVKALEDAAPEVQRAAAESLRRIGRPAVPALVEALKDPNAVRPAEVLAKIGPAAIRELAMGLRSTDVAVRSGCAEIFGRMGPGGSDAQPLLIEALKDPAPEVRVAAARALGLMAPNSAASVDSLVLVLKDKQRPVRLAAIIALGQLRAAATTAIPGLVSAMRDDDLEIRNAAANSRRMIEGH
jgi:HEAT repeat protein